MATIFCSVPYTALSYGMGILFTNVQESVLTDIKGIIDELAEGMPNTIEMTAFMRLS